MQRTTKSSKSTNSTEFALSIRSVKTGKIIGYCNILDKDSAALLKEDPTLITSGRLTFEPKEASSGGF